MHQTFIFTLDSAISLCNTRSWTYLDVKVYMMSVKLLSVTLISSNLHRRKYGVMFWHGWSNHGNGKHALHGRVPVADIRSHATAPQVAYQRHQIWLCQGMVEECLHSK